MATLKYKIGNKVILTNGNIMTIDQIDDISKWYTMKEDPWNYYTDEMIEGFAEDSKPKFKVGDRVIVRGMSGIWEITNVKEEDTILYTIKKENHTFTITTYGGFLTSYESVSDRMVENKTSVSKPQNPSMLSDLEEEAYSNPHKVAQMQAYEAGFKAALVALSGFIDQSIKEL